MELLTPLYFLRGVIFVLLFFVPALVLLVISIPPLALGLIVLGPVSRLARRCYRRMADSVGAVWLGHACFLLEAYAGVKIRLTVGGDEDDGSGAAILPPRGERALVILNHHSHFDWYPTLCLMARCGQLGTLRIMLKHELRPMPIFGWAFQMLMYIFLVRDKHTDIAWIRRIIGHFLRNDYPASIMLFPEGTDFCTKQRNASRVFAEERGLRVYNHVLHPRTAGFVEVTQMLGSKLDAIYDITMSYKYFGPRHRPKEIDMITGRFPRAVEMHLHRIPASSLPQDAEGLHQWCREVFEKKEDMLTRAAGEGKPSSSHLGVRLPGLEPPLSSTIRLWMTYISCSALVFTLTYYSLCFFLTFYGALYFGASLAVVLLLTHPPFGLDHLALNIDDSARGAMPDPSVAAEERQQQHAEEQEQEQDQEAERDADGPEPVGQEDVGGIGVHKGRSADTDANAKKLN